MSGLKKVFASSFLLSFETILRKLVGLASTLVLARVLVPEDFGLVAIAVLIMGFCETFHGFGGGTYIMKAKEVTVDMINTVWTINIIIAIATASIFVVFAPFIANYYDDERLLAIFLVYASMLIVRTMGNPGTIMLRREQNYLPIVKVDILSKFTSVALAITIALTYKNHWALVVGQYSMALTGVIGGYFIHNHRPKWCLTEFKKIWNFSFWLLLQSILSYIRSQLDTLLVSSTFSKASLGSYHTMKYLSSMPMTFLIAPATEPLFVELAKLKDNIEYFSRQYLISVVAPQVIAVPIAVYMLGNHELVTNILLGEKWLPYSKLLTIFSFAAVFVILWQKAIQLLILDEHSKLFFRCELGSFVGVYLLLITLAPSDIELFAFFKVLIEATLGILLFAWVVTKKLGLKVTVRMLILLLPIVFASTLAFSTTYISINFGVIWDFIIHTILFFLLYFVCLISFAWLVKNKIAEWGYLWEVGLRAISQFRREKAPRGC